MNMISTAFPIEVDASNEQKNLVAKLVSAWEKKNSKAARAGGLSLMALSLAACGAEDSETAFTQADVTAAATAATAAAEAAAVVSTAEAVAAAEFVAAAAAEAAAAAAVVATAEAVAAAEFVAAALDTTPFSQADVTAAEAAATAAAEAAAATAATAAAEAAATAQAAAVAAVDITTDNAAAHNLALRNSAAELGVSNTATMTNAELLQAIKTADNAGLADAAVAALNLTGVATLAQLNTAYSDLATPSTVTLVGTTGVDTMSGSANADTFTFADIAGATTMTVGDSVDGLGGSDQVSVVSATAIGVAPTGFTVSNVETMNLTSGAGITFSTASGFTGLTALNSTGVLFSALTAATTTNVTATVTGNTAATANTIDGGNNVTATYSVAGVANAAVGGAITIGATTQAVGDVVVTDTVTSSNATNNATTTGGAISVTGGSTITIDQGIQNDAASKATVKAAGTTVTATHGALAATGGTSTTAVTVNQDAEVTAVAIGGSGVTGVINGTVTIADGNLATASDTITSVTLANQGATTITSSVLSALNLTGGSAAGTESGAITINKSAADTSTDATTLTVTGSGFHGAIDGTLADIYTTVNMVATSAMTIADVNLAAATAINASGAGVTTITATTDTGLVSAYTSTGGGLTVGAVIGNAVDFAGGDGADSVSLGATTKDITMGAGNDNVTISAALGLSGSVAGGDGADTLTMTSVVAAANDGNATFNSGVSGFETINLTTAIGAGNTIDFAALNAPSTLVMDVQGANATTAIANNLADNSTVEVKSSGIGSTVNISGASAATNDTLNIKLSNSTAAADAFGTFTVASVENVNIETNDSGAGASVAATIDTLTLTAAAAKAITVTGNNGLTLTNTATTVTSFNSTGVVANDAVTVDTAANLAVGWTTGVLAGASTIVTGSGNDVIDASAAVKATSITSGAGIDTITGSATAANVLTSGSQNDSIIGGAAADTVDGGAGSDTFTVSSAALLEQAGSGTTIGHIVNLGATALTGASIFTVTGTDATNTGDFLAGAQSTVASNSATLLYSTESNTNVNLVDTIVNVENIIGGTGRDYIVGSAAANVIEGGALADIITTGGGADTVKLAAIAVTGSAVGADTITDFTVGVGGDVIRVLDGDYTWSLGTNGSGAADPTVVIATGTDALASNAATGNATVHTISDDVITSTVALLQAGTKTITQLEGTIATAMGTTLTATYGANHVVVAVDDGTDTMIVRYSDGGTDGVVAAEISLLAILDGLADATTLTADNFSFA